MRRLNTITAAAGAGKTTRIVADIAREVTTRAPEEVLATTFTIKAADELVERARAKLFEGGEFGSRGPPSRSTLWHCQRRVRPNRQ
ncbi:UvrD-helicase domain-containing protein [Sinorhizobium medicae]